MKLTTTTEQTSSTFKIDHSDKVVLIGSCFSDEMSSNLKDAGFYVNSNPFGTLFHPMAIANEIRASIQGDNSVNLLKREDIYLTWGTAAKINTFSENELTFKVHELRQQLKADLSGNCALVVTFGTAWGYIHKELNKIVGNCHKAPASTFDKNLTHSDEIITEWKSLLTELRELNPSLKVIFTVSPVRHVKDGLIDNNRSKARLIEAVHELANGSISYFPAYEIVIDELRDYRFYSEDLVHPNSIAVTHVYKRFEELYFTEAAIELSREVLKVKRLLAHKSLFPNSREDKERLIKADSMKNELSKLHPEIQW